MAEPLADGSFAPFGEVIGFDARHAYPANDGHALRCDMPARIETDAAGRAIVAIYRARAQFLPLSLTLLECHPHSSQTFVSLNARRFLIVVAPAGAQGSPDIATARAFIGSRGQGVNYRRAVWHAPITALDVEGDFSMLIWQRGSPEDCIVHRLASPLHIGDRT
jgi:ureidoglycolate lyase